MAASPGPSFCPHKFHPKFTLGLRSPFLLRSRNQTRKKNPPPSRWFSPEKTQNPRLSSSSAKRPASLRHRQLRHLPLRRSPKFRDRTRFQHAVKFVNHRYFLFKRDSQCFSLGHASWRT
ncbi:hypothetical protein AVEN_56365-1 [Araneus ventricosus]|uniref:Uncharacterized protein n=1 Tax=Araneus ventricosus TaxID=182803 RepID=A0A4Y2LMK3_ARAVE|nr:hypothetical protein AVEN_56365-1 [Araneus ventricosus]